MLRILRPDAISQQTVRSVAGGGSTANYLGKVHVAKGADGTDAVAVGPGACCSTGTARPMPSPSSKSTPTTSNARTAARWVNSTSRRCSISRSAACRRRQRKQLMLQAFVAEAFVGAADEEALLAQALAALEAML